MVSKIIGLLNREVKSINQGALLLALFSFASQLLGLVRDRSLAHFFGASATLDVYYAAFRIPDFLYSSFASIVSVTALIPFLAHYLKGRSEEKGRQALVDFSRTLFSVFSVSMVVLCLLAALLMRPLSFLVVPGFDESARDLFVTLSRILLLSPVLLGLSNLFGSFSQIQKKFYAFALAPLCYNAAILAGIFILRPVWGIEGIVLGVVAGAALHMAIQLPTLSQLSLLPSFTFRPKLELFMRVVRQSLPRTLSLSLSSVALLVLGAIASGMTSGSISIFNFSYNIQTTPFYIIGISYAVAAFPVLSKFFHEERYQEFLSIMYRAAKNIFFFSIPLSLLFIVLRAQVVRVLLGTGMFDWSDTRLVAASLALFSLSITAQSMVLLLTRGFYAMGHTKIPLVINSFSLVFTIILSLVLVWLYQHVPALRFFLESLLRLEGLKESAVILLPLSFSIGQIINALVLWQQFQERCRATKAAIKDFGRIVFHILGASIIGAGAGYLALRILAGAIYQETLLGILLQGSMAAISGILVFLAVISLLDHEELRAMVKVFTSRFWKERPIAPEQSEL